MDNQHRTIIGKDIIESLTLGMYEDSRFIFREYIQNAADQIDKAVAQKVLPSRKDGKIWINIDKDEKKITIEDNATGIKKTEVVKILKNIAQSTKQRGIDKGFRGIGRLGGIAYCDELIFETSYKGETTKSVMIWSAKELKDIINNRSKEEEAVKVIDQVTDFDFSNEDENKHYFRVILENVSNALLLDFRNIQEYLSMIAPAPLHPRFTLIEKIYSSIKADNLSIDEYTIYVNSDAIFKAYTTKIYEGIENNKKAIDEIFDIQTFTLKMDDDSFLAWGWYGISNFKKQIPEKGNIARGIRLRSGNIQIGNAYCLNKLHKEQRGNFYFFGEVHALHKDLIPNARRDYFLDTHALKIFEDKLKNLFKNDLYKLYHFASSIRSKQKRIDRLTTFKSEYQQKIDTGFTNKDEAEVYKEKFTDLKDQAEKATQELNKIKQDVTDTKSPQSKILNRTCNGEDVTTRTNPQEIYENDKLKYLTDNLSKLTKKDRKLISRVYSVIDKVLPKEIAENLKLKINEELSD
ncbi:MAG: ATP-binding protein [Deferribacteres bacterium]|nr:ATP-binding protein [candidate division KSB1 bacterium]MCB9501378.1 ATP-binding protein [Deferribacteres bacterium]